LLFDDLKSILKNQSSINLSLIQQKLQRKASLSDYLVECDNIFNKDEETAPFANSSSKSLFTGEK
jgi:hypothetical protein